jgi:hypothetical protein
MEDDKAYDYTNQWAQARRRLLEMHRTLPSESAIDAAARKRKHGVVQTPWTDSYRNGGKGPILIDSHGQKDHFDGFVLPAGTEIRGNGYSSVHTLSINLKVHGVSGGDFAHILHKSRSFQEAYARNPDGPFANIVCLVGGGKASRELVDEMRNLGYDNVAHAARGTVIIFPDEIFDNTSAGQVGVYDNGGWITYDRGMRTHRDRPETRYSSGEINRILELEAGTTVDTTVSAAASEISSYWIRNDNSESETASEVSSYRANSDDSGSDTDTSWVASERDRRPHRRPIHIKRIPREPPDFR